MLAGRHTPSEMEVNPLTAVRLLTPGGRHGVFLVPWSATMSSAINRWTPPETRATAREAGMRALLSIGRSFWRRKPYRGRLICPEGRRIVRPVKRGGPDGVVLPKSPHLAF